MLVVDNRTNFAADRNWVRDQTGAHHWIVAVKATFDLGADGRVTVADEQPAPLLAPEHHGEPGTSSLHLDADLGLPKPGVDVIVHGLAHAPHGRPVTELPVTLRLPGVEKTLLVVGDSTLRGDLGRSRTAPQPFTSMPIVYERAFGGFDPDEPDLAKRRFDTRNPVGTGYTPTAKLAVGRRAPNILYPGKDMAGAGPAGFGPIESFWSPRREFGGTYDARWMAEQHPFLPDDWDPRHTLCAPVDQRTPRPLRGGESLALSNMTPDGSLQFTLPKLYFTFTTFFGRRSEEHRARLASVLVFADRRQLAMVWQTSLMVPLRAMDYLDRTLIKEKPYLS